MHQLVFGSCSVETFVGEKNHGPTNAKKTIRYEHDLVVPEVPILGYVLGTDDDDVGVGVNLNHVFCEVNGAAAHAAKVEAFGVTAKLVLVDDHGGEGKGGIEEAAVDDKDADVFGVDKGEARRREMVSKKEGWSETKGRSSEEGEAREREGWSKGTKGRSLEARRRKKKNLIFFHLICLRLLTWSKASKVGHTSHS
ncbi:hypothetical protein AAZX31_01G030200 [Glycine max]